MKKFIIVWTWVFVVAMSVFSAHAQDLSEFQNRFTIDYLDHDSVRSVLINCNDTLQHTIEITNSEVCPGRCEVSIYEHDEEQKLIGRYQVEE